MAKLKKKILIVDDDTEIRKAIRLVLEEQDYLNFEVTESDNVASAIQKMKDIRPDIVILDLYINDETGFDFMDIINKNKRFANTKVIMLTAYDTQENVFKAEAKGIEPYNFLSKPFNISDLLALVLSLSLPSITSGK